MHKSYTYIYIIYYFIYITSLVCLSFVVALGSLSLPDPRGWAEREEVNMYTSRRCCIDLYFLRWHVGANRTTSIRWPSSAETENFFFDFSSPLRMSISGVSADDFGAIKCGKSSSFDSDHYKCGGITK